MSFANRITALSGMAVLAFVALAGPASAEIPRTKVAEQLTDFKSAASQMHRQAGDLKSFTPGKQLNWQTHAYTLDVLKSYVNEMGKSLAELEGLRPEANADQAMAIEHARAHLVSVAQNLTQAIDLVREDRSNVHRSEYGEVVNNIYDHTEALYTKLDTILDYENAKARFNQLELQPNLSGGS